MDLPPESKYRACPSPLIPSIASLPPPWRLRPPPPQSLATTASFHVSMVLPFPKFHINRIRVCTLWVWPLSLWMIHWGAFHVSCESVAWFFFLPLSSIAQVSHGLFIYQLTDVWTVSRFCQLWIKQHTFVLALHICSSRVFCPLILNTGRLFYECTFSFLLDKNLGVRRWVIYSGYLLSEESVKLFSKVAVPLCIPPSNVWDSELLCILDSTWCAFVAIVVGVY